jgi:hypothetical protein
MTDQKPAKGDDGHGIPPGAEQKTVEPQVADNRSVPGGSLKAARRAIGVNAMDHYDKAPTIKAALPDLSETPGWNMVPKDDRK